ncbi:hypothetical protein CMK17_19355, partial [Candidatus Poribacteria bacterium]|nr:hypothetical protein [Candidatus Poribacteria bacterium]
MEYACLARRAEQPYRPRPLHVQVAPESDETTGSELRYVGYRRSGDWPDPEHTSWLGRKRPPIRID